MGKIKLDELEHSYIINFLKYDDKKINVKWVRNAALSNVTILLLSILFSDSKVLWAGIVSVICMVILISLISFIKKGEYSKKNLYFNFGIYTCFFCVSIGTLTIQIIWMRLKRKFIWMIIVYVIASVVVVYITYLKYMKRISQDYYKNNYQPPIAKAAAGASFGVLLSQIDGLDQWLLFGTMVLIVGVMCASNIYFFIKSYCYSLISDEELKKAYQKAKQKRYMFTNYK